MAVLRLAVAERRQVEIDYYAFGRDELTTRTVDPYAVYSASGQWYLSAWSHDVDDHRLFRVDRVRRARMLDQTFEPPADRATPAVYEARPDDPRAVIELEPAARWVVEQYPIEKTKEMAKGRVRVTMAISERAWLERLLLRLGPDGRVVKADSDLAGAGRDAACRLLARYRRPG
jgi:proteasome accessory factor C